MARFPRKSVSVLQKLCKTTQAGGPPLHNCEKEGSAYEEGAGRRPLRAGLVRATHIDNF